MRCSGRWAGTRPRPVSITRSGAVRLDHDGAVAVLGVHDDDRRRPAARDPTTGDHDVRAAAGPRAADHDMAGTVARHVDQPPNTAGRPGRSQPSVPTRRYGPGRRPEDDCRAAGTPAGARLSASVGGQDLSLEVRYSPRGRRPTPAAPTPRRGEHRDAGVGGAAGGSRARRRDRGLVVSKERSSGRQVSDEPAGRRDGDTVPPRSTTTSTSATGTASEVAQSERVDGADDAVDGRTRYALSPPTSTCMGSSDAAPTRQQRGQVDAGVVPVRASPTTR